MRRSIVIALAIGLLPAAAAADDFASFTDQEPITSRDLGVHLWARSGGVCANARDEADRLVCQQVARALAERAANRTFFWRVSEGVLSAGHYDERSKSVPIVVESCLACKGVEAGKGKLIVVGRTGKSSEPAPLRHTTKVFNTTAKAERWQKEALPRLVGEYLFRIPSELARLKVGEHDAVFVDVEAYRIYDRCTGEVAISKPKVERVKVYPAKDCQEESKSGDEG